MSVLVTGATGNVGQRLLTRLLAEGRPLHVLAQPGTEQDLPRGDDLMVFSGELEDARLLARATRGVETVYHLAGLTAKIGHDPAAMQAVNTQGTARLLEASTANGVRRFVFSSSVAVYSPHPFPRMWPIREDTALQPHGSALMRSYGQSKLDAERCILQAHRDHNLDYVILRAAMTYGPGIDYVERFVWRLLREALLGRTAGLRPATMQWLHVEDFAEALWLAGRRAEATNQVFVIAGSRMSSPLEVFDKVTERLLPAGLPPPPAAAQRAATRLRYDIDKARRMIGFEPAVTFDEGILEVLEAMNLNALPPNHQDAPQEHFAAAGRGGYMQRAFTLPQGGDGRTAGRVSRGNTHFDRRG